MRVIFMGTSEFGVPALQALINDSDFEIVAVYTKAPQIANRGHKITNSVIHDLALKNNLPVITPRTLKDNTIQKEFADFNADIVVVVSYGLILPAEILAAPKLGCVNIHPSLLPRWRGAAPIQRTIMAGDAETAVDIIQMDKGLDSGDILAEQKISLDDKINYHDLSEKLSIVGAELLIKTLKNIATITPIKQSPENIVYAHKIDKTELLINWQESARRVHNQIRGLNGAYFEIKNEKIKIHQAEIINESSHSHQPGTIIDDKMTIACVSGLIRPKILQRAGKNKMALGDFLRGFVITS